MTTSPEYTPSTDEMRRLYMDLRGGPANSRDPKVREARKNARAEFERWLEKTINSGWI